MSAPGTPSGRRREELWALAKQDELYTAVLRACRDRVLLELHRNRRRVYRMPYLSRAEAFRVADDYRGALHIAGWSDAG